MRKSKCSASTLRVGLLTLAGVLLCASCQPPPPQPPPAKRVAPYTISTRPLVVVQHILTPALLPHPAKLETSVRAPDGTHDPRLLYATVLRRLHSATPVPILLPSDLSAASGPTLSAFVSGADWAHYEVSIVGGADCRGATACEQMYVMGETLGSTPAPLTGTPVQLSDGRTGYYRHSTCGSSCSPSYVVWDMGSNRYTVGIKAGLKAAVVRAANSMQRY